MSDLSGFLGRCTFPPAGSSVVCGLSGGADSTALVALAVTAGCSVSAVHVHHGLRPSADDDADTASISAETLGVPFEVRYVDVADGPNLEARARAARQRALGAAALTGHTADDQAETLLLALLRGSGAAGLGAMSPGPTRPILALRRTDTVEVCERLGLAVATDPTNDDPRFRRNRIRHELLPLLDDIAERDVTVLLARTATLLRDDEALLDELALAVDPTDAAAVHCAPRPVAARAIRRWLQRDGYPPDAAAVGRVLGVAAGDAAACEIGGGVRVERRRGRLELYPSGPASG
jgi:tRNA(Ile)-lysidine synthase